MTATEVRYLIGRRVEVTFGPANSKKSGRLMSVRGRHVGIETRPGIIVSYADAVVELTERCGEEYQGENWMPGPCEKAPGHGPEGFHCDRYGRTW